MTPKPARKAEYGWAIYWDQDSSPEKVFLDKYDAKQFCDHLNSLVKRTAFKVLRVSIHPVGRGKKVTE